MEGAGDGDSGLAIVTFEGAEGSAIGVAVPAWPLLLLPQPDKVSVVSNTRQRRRAWPLVFFIPNKFKTGMVSSSSFPTLLGSVLSVINYNSNCELLTNGHGC
ncbi:hypothetical protein PaeBR_13615 [Paenibacillus sp. BR2-3]|uniref:hypothetical protein n=1 Tax=Paenibacillus sp. BR2-3 TaxID=3048494 RepID=UPI00397771BB